MKREKGDVLRYALINAFGTTIYIVVVVFFISAMDGSLIDGKKETLLAPILMLMLFVFSAAFTGTLVFGRPVIWYLDGKKREALALLFYTLAIFMLLTMAAFLVFAIGQKI